MNQTPSAPDQLPLGKLARPKGFLFLVAPFLVITALLVWWNIRTLPEGAELPPIAVVPEWTLMNESGQPFGSANLKGKVYLANFIFSRCPSVCPKMLKDTALLQHDLKSYGQKVAIATFTVDPDYDQPKILQQVARDHQADPYVWTFLTSEHKDALMKLYRDGFKVGVSTPDPVVDLFDVAHSEKIVLVDQESRIRGFYSYHAEDLAKLKTHVAQLLGSK